MILLILYIIFSILLSRSILKANLFNIASIALISYWAAYPIENIKIGEKLYQSIDGLKEIGIYLYAIFGFSFLLGAFLSRKMKLKKIEFYRRINSESKLFFISLILGFLGLLCFLNTYNFNLPGYINFTLNISRAERLSTISTAKNALPYSIFFIPSITTFLIAIKNFGSKKSLTRIILSPIIIIINSPILFSYLIEGDRTALIKFGVSTLFILGLNKYSIETKCSKILLIENFKINKKVLINRLKITIILITLFFIFSFIGHSRDNGWENTNSFFKALSEKYQTKSLPVNEFRAVNYTIDFALARNDLNIKKTETMFTWDKFIFYPLPTYVYKAIFNEKKPPSIGKVIGLETKNFVYGEKDNRKLGFALSPIAEGFINLGYLGVFITGLIYGLSVGFIQSLYNKISLARINLFDIFVLNTIGILPLIMRVGSTGIYNWIFSTSFVIFLPILIIDIYERINSKKFAK